MAKDTFKMEKVKKLRNPFKNFNEFCLCIEMSFLQVTPHSHKGNRLISNGGRTNLKSELRLEYLTDEDLKLRIDNLVSLLGCKHDDKVYAEAPQLSIMMQLVPNISQTLELQKLQHEMYYNRDKGTLQDRLQYLNWKCEHSCPLLVHDVKKRTAHIQHMIQKSEQQNITQVTQSNEQTKIENPKSKQKSITQHVKRQVASEQQWRCKICTDLLTETFEIDHIIPKKNGGTNAKENLQALCPNCHRTKTNLDRKRTK